MMAIPLLQIPYGVLERALTTSYGVPEAVRETGFRGMLNNLQKLGVLGEAARVGRGTPLVYTPIELHRFIVAIELCELGVPPATAVALISSYWKKFESICARAELNNPAMHGGEPIDPDDDVILFLGGVGLRTGSLRGAQSPAIPNIDHCKLRDLPRHMAQWLRMDSDGDAAESPPRALVINLSARLRSFHAAMLGPWMEEARSARADSNIKPTWPRARKRK
jgi:hypothetical protein